MSLSCSIIKTFFFLLSNIPDHASEGNFSNCGNMEPCSCGCFISSQTFTGKVKLLVTPCVCGGATMKAKLLYKFKDIKGVHQIYKVLDRTNCLHSALKLLVRVRGDIMSASDTHI